MKMAGVNGFHCFKYQFFLSATWLVMVFVLDNLWPFLLVLHTGNKNEKAGNEQKVSWNIWHLLETNPEHLACQNVKDNHRLRSDQRSSVL